MQRLHRVCVKLYADAGDDIGDDVFVPIFHDWIRARALPELVLIDVADYTHVPESPGVMLISHAVSCAMDRSDGRRGLLVQRRHTVAGDAVDVIATTVRQALGVADRLEDDPRLRGRLKFDRSALRVEANDRLCAPNSEGAFDAFEPLVRAAAADVFTGCALSVTRVANDARDRLAADVRVTPRRDAVLTS